MSAQAQLELLQLACRGFVMPCFACFAGLELYENVLSPEEQANMIHTIEDWVVQVSSCS